MGGSTNRKAIREHNPAWIEMIPELKTRPTLTAALCNRTDIRRKVFQVANSLESIALIPSKHVACQCLALWWRDQKRQIYRDYHDKLRAQTGDDTLYNELRGTLHNVFINMLLKSGNNLPKSFKGNEWHVCRNYYQTK